MSSTNKPHSEDKTTVPDGAAGAAPATNPWLAGLRCRCPRCGKGPVFSGFLNFADSCSACGQDFRAADSGDGPAVFVILIGGAIAVIFALGLEFAFHPPMWVHMALSLPIALVICIGLLRPFKATLFALQFANKAAEIRREDWDQ
ncbi:MAG: DUF983 domain-containing protein [Caulobacterales bacterium]